MKGKKFRPIKGTTKNSYTYKIFSGRPLSSNYPRSLDRLLPPHSCCGLKNTMLFTLKDQFSHTELGILCHRRIDALLIHFSHRFQLNSWAGIYLNIKNESVSNVLFTYFTIFLPNSFYSSFVNNFE